MSDAYENLAEAGKRWWETRLQSKRKNAEEVFAARGEYVEKMSAELQTLSGLPDALHSKIFERSVRISKVIYNSPIEYRKITLLLAELGFSREFGVQTDSGVTLVEDYMHAVGAARAEGGKAVLRLVNDWGYVHAE